MEKDEISVGLYLRGDFIGNNSLEHQKEECIKKAHKLFGDNITITFYVDEGVSARSLKGRIGLNHMILDVRMSKLDAIITYDISRISRTLTHCLCIIEEIRDSNVKFILVKERG
ncbi:recombinase family protein [Oceanobacillus caeni]|uniref:recombinase family protein n=1 Tax=Oceanobacillus caeni TaxID=405946 RepID=UPI00362DF01C